MRTYHFIGIGGISMSALAQTLKSFGANVQGSDLKPSNITRQLEAQKIKVFYKHNKKNVQNADIVVVSNAISESNPELETAKILGLQIITRAELLGKIASLYKYVIAIAGAHGKTSTTEMLAEIFITANKKPTIHIGGISNYFNSNLKLGRKKFFICEACEYKNSFLKLFPSASVITNIEREHLDFFKNYKNIVKSFEKFEKNSKFCVKVDKENYIAYSENIFLQARNIVSLGNGKHIYNCFLNNNFLGKIELNAIGKHNILNSLCAILVSLHFNIPFKKIAYALKNYKGVKRRFEEISNEPLIISDYAHHPTEIKKVISSTKSFRKSKIIVAFQPHTFSRTQTLFQQFIDALSLADELHVIKTYSAREKFVKEASALSLSKHLPNSHYHASMQSAYNSIKKRLNSEDTLLILGAGNIDELAEMFRKEKTR